MPDRLRRLRRWLVRRERLDVVVVGARAGRPVTPPGVTVRAGGAGDLAALEGMDAGSPPPATRLRRGDRAWVAEREDGALVGCIWAAGGAIRLDHYRLRVRPRPGEQYAYGLYVRPDARGMGIGTALERLRVVDGLREGVRRFTEHVDPGNALAIGGGPGAHPVEALTLLVIGDRRGLVVRRRQRRAVAAPARVSATASQQ